MSDIFLVTYCALWGIVIVLACAIFFLYRHHGQMIYNTREGRASQGPSVGRKLPAEAVRSIPPVGRDASFLVFFGSSTCDLCKRALPGLQQVALRSKGLFQVWLIWQGATVPPEVKNCNIRVLEDIDGRLFKAWSVATIPFAVAVNRDMSVNSKSMIPINKQHQSPEEVSRLFDGLIKNLSLDPSMRVHQKDMTLDDNVTVNS